MNTNPLVGQSVGQGDTIHFLGTESPNSGTPNVGSGAGTAPGAASAGDTIAAPTATPSQIDAARGLASRYQSIPGLYEAAKAGDIGAAFTAFYQHTQTPPGELTNPVQAFENPDNHDVADMMLENHAN